MQVTIWLKNGTIYRNVTVAGANLKVRGNPLNFNSVSKIDSAYIYTDWDAKIEREEATGSVQISVAGVAGSVSIDLSEIDELVPGTG